MKTRLERRTFLKGMGTTMALPLLDAMLPGALLAAGTGAAAKPPVRAAFVFFPIGAIMPSWTPEKTGADYELSPTLAPLAKVKSELLVLGGLTQHHARANGDGPGDHARSAAAFLTGEQPVKTSGANIRVGVSVDQVAAEQIGPKTHLPSLELGTERGRSAGNCDSGYSCAYSNNIAWKNPSTPVAKEINPKLVFERMFGSGDERESAAARAQRTEYRKSILDLVAEDASRLKGRLGQTDRAKIDEYFQSVRELEQRIARAAAADESRQAKRPELSLPEGVPGDMTEHIRLMYDLLALAFQTDSTRVATYMVANEGSNRTYPMVGVKDGHHTLSHHGNDQKKIEQIQKIDKFLVGEFARFVEKLHATPEGQGTLLDNCMVLYGSGIADGNGHSHHNLPIILAGRGGGTIQPGRHVVHPKNTPLNNLFLSMLDRVGAEVESLGDSTARLGQLD
ncbi:MAG: DUF1552 domain-containing protein, partial [Planctomycetales bacterium]